VKKSAFGILVLVLLSFLLLFGCTVTVDPVKVDGKPITGQNPQDSEIGVIEKQFVDNLDGTVTDSNSGLMWEKTSFDNTVSFNKAVQYCEESKTGDFEDWRLPSKEELESFMDYACQPEKLGANCKGAWTNIVFDSPKWGLEKFGVYGLWSSTQGSKDGNYAYVLHTSKGIIGDAYKPLGITFSVRCVRLN